MDPQDPSQTGASGRVLRNRTDRTYAPDGSILPQPRPQSQLQSQLPFRYPEYEDEVQRFQQPQENRRPSGMQQEPPPQQHQHHQQRQLYMQSYNPHPAQQGAPLSSHPNQMYPQQAMGQLQQYSQFASDPYNAYPTAWPAPMPQEGSVHDPSARMYGGSGSAAASSSSSFQGEQGFAFSSDPALATNQQTGQLRQETDWSRLSGGGHYQPPPPALPTVPESSAVAYGEHGVGAVRPALLPDVLQSSAAAESQILSSTIPDEGRPTSSSHPQQANQPQAAVHHPKRRIAQSACETCRRKRTKCVTDAGHVSCNVCRSLRIPCLFSGVDKRKESVRVLRSRLAQLEDLVGRLQTCGDDEVYTILSNLRGNTVSPSSPTSPVQLSKSLPLSIGSQTPGQQSSTATGKVPTSHGSERGHASTDEGVGASNMIWADSGKSSRASSGSNDSTAVKETLAELTDRLTIDSRGTIRAESAASTLAFEPSRKNKPDYNPSKAAAASNEGEDAPVRLDIALGPNIELPEGTSLETIEHLLNLYFTWEHPLHPVISRPAFLRDMAAGDGPYFSSLLLNAILAFACTMSDRADLRSDQDDPHSVGEHFFVMADDMLTEEIDGAIGPVRVPITTVQALVVMVMRLLATGNELKAWMFIGTCARMTLEMGLHLDARAFLQGSPASGAHALTENDLYVRATTFWAVWIFEQEMCTVFGRTGILRDTVITCPRPESFDTPWSRRLDLQWNATIQTGSIVERTPQMSNKNSIKSLLRLARQLASIFAHSMRLIYYQVAVQPSSKSEEGQNALNQATSRIRELVKSLPPISTLDDQRGDSDGNNTPPQLLIHLHLLVHSHVILINRPFMTGSAGAEVSTGASASSTTQATAGAQDSPRIRCIKSALSIIGLLYRWRSTFASDLRTAPIVTAHILMSAATVFLNELSSILVAKTHRSARASPVASANAETTQDEVYPQEADYRARQHFGRRHLFIDVYPLLQEMAVYRPGPGQVLQRLKEAVNEREALLRSHEARNPRKETSQTHREPEANSSMEDRRNPQPFALSEQAAPSSFFPAYSDISGGSDLTWSTSAHPLAFPSVPWGAMGPIAHGFNAGNQYNPYALAQETFMESP